MPSQSAHRSTADRHLVAFQDVVDKHPDWGAVMLFYSALHLIEEACAPVGIHNTTHVNRELCIKSRFAQIWSSYHRLENESLKARYIQNGAFCLPASGVRGELLGVHYNKVKQFAAAQVAASTATTTAKPPTK